MNFKNHLDMVGLAICLNLPFLLKMNYPCIFDFKHNTVLIKACLEAKQALLLLFKNVSFELGVTSYYGVYKYGISKLFYRDIFYFSIELDWYIGITLDV